MKKVIKKGTVFFIMIVIAAFVFSDISIAGSGPDGYSQWDNASGNGGPPVMQNNGRRPHPPAVPVMRALDTDRDGLLSASEIAGASTALLTLDKDGDGVLSRDELRPGPPGGFRGGPEDDRPSLPGQNDSIPDTP